MADNPTTLPFAIAIHGGAGTILAEKMTVELETAYHAGLKFSFQQVMLSEQRLCHIT